MDSYEVKERYDNLPNKRLLNSIGIISIFLIILGLALYLAHPSIIGLIGSFVLAFIIYFQLWWRQYVVMPRSVEIMKDGVQLTFQYSKPAHYCWSDIVVVHVSSSTPSPNLKIPIESVMKVKGKFSSIPITHDNAIGIRERYNESMGFYPMSLEDRYGKGRRSISQ